MDDKNKNQCLKKLKDLGAPLQGWMCNMIDEHEDLTTCDLCDCAKVHLIDPPAGASM